MRLAWPGLRERRSMKTTSPPAAAKNAAPTASAPPLPSLGFSDCNAVAFVCAIETFAGAAVALVFATGFDAAAGNGEFATSNFGAGGFATVFVSIAIGDGRIVGCCGGWSRGAFGGLVPAFVPIMIIGGKTTRGCGGG